MRLTRDGQIDIFAIVEILDGNRNRQVDEAIGQCLTK